MSVFRIQRSSTDEWYDVEQLTSYEETIDRFRELAASGQPIRVIIETDDASVARELSLDELGESGR